MSKMVPKLNSYRSDLAMGELVKKYPQRVVLGCLYSGVATAYVKPTGVSAFPPFFYDGFSLEESIKTEKFHYPESPTYPLVNFLDGKYLGRTGSFTVPPFRAVDEIPRWVPLWFPSMGKAHAYNLLGGKKSNLEFELPRDNQEQLDRLATEIASLKTAKNKSLSLIAEKVNSIEKLKSEITKAEQEVEPINEDQKKLREIQKEITNFRETLSKNPAIAAVITPQIDKRLQQRDQILVKYVEDSNYTANLSEEELSDIKSRLIELDEQIANFRNTLSANPNLAGFVQPQIDKRLSEKSEIESKLSSLDNQNSLELSDSQRKQAASAMLFFIEENSKKGVESQSLLAVEGSILANSEKISRGSIKN